MRRFFSKKNEKSLFKAWSETKGDNYSQKSEFTQYIYTAMGTGQARFPAVSAHNFFIIS